MDYSTIRYAAADGVASVTLDRPDHLNAWTLRMAAELGHAMARADADDGVRAVVLTGAGRAFCAGADLSGGGFDAVGSADGIGGEVGLLPYEVRKPVIAAINGHAVGVGITYPLQCDVRFVAEDAKVAFAFVRRGVVPEMGSSWILPRVVGLSVAADLVLSGRTFSGREAVALGLASRALPAGEVLPAALDLAREMATQGAPVAMAIAKRLLWQGLEGSLAAQRRREVALFGWAMGQADAREGVAAFRERRPASWTLRPSADLPAWPE